MLQKKKNDTFRQRPIRRNTEYFQSNEEENKPNQNENIRAKRFFGAEAPKTFNRAFGNLHDYLKFFQNRGPDIRELITLFTDIEATDNLDLLSEVIQPYLIQSFQSEANKIHALTNDQKYYVKKLLELFQRPLPSIKQFYANILKAYTMEGFLYGNLNRYLRDENWNQLDSLLFYAYCLCKAFLRSEFTSNPNDNSQNTMIVYRGAQFDEIALSFYDMNTLKNFCWNSVTSTSRSRHVAESFMYFKFDPKKAPVLFIIEVPFNFEDSSKWIDIKPYSAIPNEDAVVLSPGSVFELTNIKRSPQDTVEISLKLVTNVNQLAHQGQIMHGTMYSEMTDHTRLKLICFEGRELSDALAHLKGNRLIEEIEFCLCKFDEKFNPTALEEIPGLKGLSFFSPFSGNHIHWSDLLRQLKKGSLERLKVGGINFDDYRLPPFCQTIRSLNCIRSLDLNFEFSKISNEGLNYLCSQGIKYLTSLTSLTLDFQYCSSVITDEGLKDLSSQISKYLTRITSLNLNFEGCPEITNEGLDYLSSQVLKNLTCFTSLILNFQGCSGITDEGLMNLSSQGIKRHTSLTCLDLNFQGCSGITDEGLESLSFSGLKYLTSLNLNFRKCNKVTDRGLNHLSSQGLRHTTKLRSLALDFNYCDKITDEGLGLLSYQGIKCLTSLTTLTLKFMHAESLTDEGLNSLAFHGLKNLTSLASLNLDLNSCYKITNEGLKKLSSQGLKFLTSLTSLEIDFSHCGLITDIGLEYLSSQGITYLISLRSLGLNFYTCMQVSEEGAKYLSSQRLKHLTSLTSISIVHEGYNGPEVYEEYLKGTRPRPAMYDHEAHNTEFFRKSQKKRIKVDLAHDESDETIYLVRSQKFESFTENILAGNYQKVLSTFTAIYMDEQLPLILKATACLDTKIMQHFPELTTLYMKPQDITDKGLKDLSSQALKYLTSFRTLYIDFFYVKQITDEGLKNLSFYGLSSLTSLTSLTLNFSNCLQISDSGLNYLATQGLKHLTSLTSLNLNFGCCAQITDEGLKNLSFHGLKPLTLLTDLDLSFACCPQITDEGLKGLSLHGLKYLTSLTFLDLCFANCPQITDRGLNHMIAQGLRHLVALTSLKLNFVGTNIQKKAWKNFCEILKYFGYQVAR